jgi:hypothetical protein
MIYAHKLIADQIVGIVGRVDLDAKVVSFSSFSAPSVRSNIDGTNAVYEPFYPTHDSKDFAYTRLVTGESKFSRIQTNGCGSVIQIPLRLVVYKRICCQDQLIADVINALSGFPFILVSANLSKEEVASAETSGLNSELINTDYAYFYIDVIVNTDLSECEDFCNIEKFVC